MSPTGELDDAYYPDSEVFCKLLDVNFLPLVHYSRNRLGWVSLLGGSSAGGCRSARGSIFLILLKASTTFTSFLDLILA